MRADPDEPERRCILTGEHGPRHGLIRLALGPGGVVLPDLGARAGGRGAWLAVSRADLERAQAKGKLRGALVRALRDPAAAAPDDLPVRIEAGLAERALARIGLEMRAGNLILGAERIGQALQGGAAGLLVLAADAGTDTRQALSAKARNGGVPAIDLPAAREALSRALGRANSVYVAVAPGGAAERVADEIGRWRAFCGLSPAGAIPATPVANVCPDGLE